MLTLMKSKNSVLGLPALKPKNDLYRVVPDTNVAGYQANNFADYRISTLDLYSLNTSTILIHFKV